MAIELRELVLTGLYAVVATPEARGLPAPRDADSPLTRHPHPRTLDRNQPENHHGPEIAGLEEMIEGSPRLTPSWRDSAYSVGCLPWKKETR